MEEGRFAVKVYGEGEETVDIKARETDLSGHAGGDVRMVLDFVRNVRSGEPLSGLTGINNSIESHRMAFAAESSRKAGGELVKL